MESFLALLISAIKDFMTEKVKKIRKDETLHLDLSLFANYVYIPLNGMCRIIRLVVSSRSFPSLIRRMRNVHVIV